MSTTSDTSSRRPVTPRGPKRKAHRLIWRFVKWRGGFPFAVVLIVMGEVVPHNGGVNLWGYTALVAVTVRYLVRKWRNDMRRNAREARAAAEAANAPEPPPPPYYAQWVGQEPPAGPYGDSQRPPSV